MKKKTVALLLALTLVVGVVAGGTIAWLIDQTAAVTNTFTVGDVGVTLVESVATNNEAEFQMIPGKQYKKDPVVEVIGNVDSYLFVRFEELNEPSKYLTYTSTLNADNGWTQSDGNTIPTNVWYRKVGADDAKRSWNLLDGDKVTVKENVVKNGTATTGFVDMPKATDAKPVLKYQAAVVQADGSADAAAAWAKLPTAFTNP